MKSRTDLGNLYNKYYLKGVGVEVGVQNGFNLKQICSQWNGQVIGVDTWPDMDIYLNAVNNLEDCNKILVRSESVKFAELLEDESLDFVYIDAAHDYESVKADFLAWFPKVRFGGVISFHDYGVNECIGVKTFIDELMKDHPDLKVNFTTDDFWEGKEYQTAWFIRRKTMDAKF